MNLTMMLEMVAESAPERVALGAREDGLTYQALHERSQALGARLRELGVDHLALLDLNGPAIPLLLFGAAAAAIPVAPLNYRLTDVQLADALRRLGNVLVVCGSGTIDRIRPESGIRVALTDEVVVQAKQGVGQWEHLDFVDPETVAVLLFTSGTTGAPKAAMLRHRHLVNYIIGSVDFFSASPEEAILVSVPNYHIAGISSVLSSVYSGRRMVQLPAFSPEGWVDMAVDEAITQAMVVPTMLDRILDVVEERRVALPTLRLLSYGGGRMPVPVIERALRLLPHVDFVNAYGLTETSSTVTVLGPEDHRNAISSDDPVVRGRLASVGMPLPTIDIEIRDEDGIALPAGADGEIYVRGEQVAGEYLTHSAVGDDGWYPTRDRGHLDDAGYLYLDGRADDVIVRGGENISPGEIEAVLQAYPGISDAAVVGVQDAEWGERIEAAIVSRPGYVVVESDVQRWVRDRLRSTRVPARIHELPGLPYNETGKLLRRVLREQLNKGA